MSQGQTMQQSVRFNLRQLRNRKTIFDRRTEGNLMDTKVIIDTKMSPEEFLAFQLAYQKKKRTLLKKRLILFALLMAVILFALYTLSNT